MKVWITKYWETQGIYEVEVDEPKDDGKDYVFTKPERGTLMQMFKLNRDAFTSKANARSDVLFKRDKRVKSLKAKIVELERMKF